MLYLVIPAMCALAAIIQAVLLGSSPAWLQAPLAIALVCILPGYAVSMAAHRRASITGTERLFMSVMLSLCATVGTGVLLHFSPWGITRVSLALFLGGITLAGCALAAWRAIDALPESASEAIVTPTWRAQVQKVMIDARLRAWQLGLLALAVIIAGGAVALAYRVADQTTTTDILQVWMLPSEKVESRQLRLGINNLAPQPLELWLSIERSGYAVQDKQLVRLDSGQKWETTIDLPRDLPGNGPVEAIVYRVDAPSTAVRRVSVWMN